MQAPAPRFGAAAVLAGAVACLWCFTPAGAADSATPTTSAAFPAGGRYRVHSSITMPHMEEALRQAAHAEELCVAAGDAGAFFPLLRQPHLQGCALASAPRNDGAIGYWLRCVQPGGPSGTAVLTAAPPVGLSGALDLKMGGKNMTMTQRVTAQRLGACE